MKKLKAIAARLTLALVTAVLIFMAGCNTSDRESAIPAQNSANEKATNDIASQPSVSTEDHGHKPGAHGGNIVSLGRDSYHVEAIVEKGGALKLYTLGKDESRVVDIEAQDLIAYVKPDGATDSIQIDVKPQPQPGDAEGKASLFVGQLPDAAVGKTIDVTIPNITIAGERFRMAFSTRSAEHTETAIPKAKDGEEARELYLTPGGIYTAADIEANGNVTAPQKFMGMTASHDLKPAPGDKICPVTLTKANPKFSWVVGGKTYEFCCPPCIDEFVALAKSNPPQIKDPSSYVQQGKPEPSNKP